MQSTSFGVLKNNTETKFWHKKIMRTSYFYMVDSFKKHILGEIQATFLSKAENLGYIQKKSELNTEKYWFWVLKGHCLQSAKNVVWTGSIKCWCPPWPKLAALINNYQPYGREDGGLAKTLMCTFQWISVRALARSRDNCRQFAVIVAFAMTICDLIVAFWGT